MKSKRKFSELVPQVKRKIVIGLSAILTVALVVSLTAVFASAQRVSVDNLTWESATEDNPLGSAIDFNLFLIGDLTNLVDSEGPVAMGGSLITTGRGFSAALSPGTVPPSYYTHGVPTELHDGIEQLNIGILVGGSVIDTKGGVVSSDNGDVVVNTNTTVGDNFTFTTGRDGMTYHSSDVTRRDLSAFFAAAEADLKNSNKQLFALAPNGTVEVTGSGDWGTTVTFTGTDPVRNIFSIDLSQYPDTAMIADVRIVVPENSDVIINVTGSNTKNPDEIGFHPLGDLPRISYDGGATSLHPAYAVTSIIWNIDPQIKKVYYAPSSSMFGALLAPNADFVIDDYTSKDGRNFGAGGSGWNGLLIANSLNNVKGTGTETHWYPYIRRSERFGGISFIKHDNTGATLAGAQFEVKNSLGSVIADVTTDSTGLVSITGLAAGRYTVVETAAPDGYEKSNYTAHIYVDANGNASFVSSATSTEALSISFIEEQFTNSKPVNASFGFTKTDSNGALLPGAVFELRDNGSNTAVKVTSDAQGSVLFDNITDGTYTLREISAPSGYIASTAVITVTVDAAGGISFAAADGTALQVESLADWFRNTKISVGFSFAKKDNLGNMLPGATFKIVNAEGNANTINIENKFNDSTISFDGLGVGEYIVTETKAPDGYTASGFELHVIVDDNGAITYKNAGGAIITPDDVITNFVNTKIVNQGISFVKKDNDGAIVPGAVFTLTKDDGTTINATSDAYGVVTFTGLTAGTYTLTETSAPDGYIKANASVKFTVGADNTSDFNAATAESRFINIRVKGSVEFTKRGNLNEVPLSGASFTISGNGINQTVKFDEGVVRFESLYVGDYVITETAAPAGYAKSDFVLYVTVDANGVTVYKNADGTVIDVAEVENQFRNHYIVDQTVIFTKKDNLGNIVPGANFYLVDARGDIVGYSVSDENGKVKFTGLTAGTYTLKESSAPEGWVYSSQELTFTVNADNTSDFSASQAEQLFTNQRVKANLTFSKKNNSNVGIGGATFKIESAPDNAYQISKETTFNSYRITFEDLYVGDYIITEVSAPEGHIKSDFELHVNVNAQGEVSFTDKDGNPYTQTDVENAFINTTIVDQSISFVKKDDLGAIVPGAEFQLTRAEDGAVFTAESDASGTVTFSGLTAGNYTLTETSAPVGYVKSESSYEFMVRIDNTTNFRADDAAPMFVNSKVKANIEFVKMSNLGTELAGARFKIVSTADSPNRVNRETTFTSGKVTFTDIYYGSYIVTEVSAPDGYQKSDFELYVTVNADGTVTYADGSGKVFTTIDEVNSQFVNIKTINQSVSLVKRDDTGKILPGATFQLQRGAVIVATAKSDENGVVRFENLTVAGNYIITEISAPDGYHKSNAQVSFNIGLDDTLTFDQKMAEDSFVNTKITNDISFTKTTNLGGVLQGAKFRIVSIDGVDEEINATRTSDENGIVTFRGLYAGATYMVEEIEAPAGYEKSDFRLYVTVNLDGSIEYKDGSGFLVKPEEITAYFQNTLIVDQSISFVKHDDLGNILPGAKFQLTDNVNTYTAIADENGVVSFTGLTEGIYKLTELSAPVGYNKSSATITVTVSVDNTTDFDKENAERVFTNNRITTSISLVKYDNLGNKLKGATFKIVGEGIEVEKTFDNTASIAFSGLYAGDYVITETAAPAGYEKSEFELHVTIATDGTVTYKDKDGNDLKLDEVQKNFENKLIVDQSISFTKRDNSGNPLPGAVFELKNGLLTITATADENGVVTFSNLAEGEYVLSEVSAPDGYVKSDKTVTIKVNVDNTNDFVRNDAEELFVNNLVLADIEFTKVDNFGEKLAGATFNVTGDHGVNETKTFNTSTIKFTGLKVGDYKITEVEAPAGYQRSTNVVTVTVNNDGTVTFKDSVSGRALSADEVKEAFQNTLTVNKSFSFVKRDNSGAALAGATFTLTDEDGNVVGTVTTDASGIVAFDNLGMGKYTITETEAPFGYRKTEETMTVEVTEKNEIIFDREEAETHFTNTLVQVSISFYKNSNLGKPLSGATFKVESIEGSAYNVTKTFTTSNNIRFSGLGVGKYAITEINAPDGYVKSEFIAYATVSVDGTVAYTNEAGEAITVADVQDGFINTLIVDQSVSFTKKTDGGAALAGAKFTLTDESGKVVATATSGIDGKVEFTGLGIGAYTITETEAPYGYRMSGKTYTFEVKVDNTTTFKADEAAADFVNTLVKANIEFVKMSNLDKGLAGAEFTIVGIDNTAYTATAVSSATGKVSFTGLTMGTYVITETGVPEGYTGSSFELHATVNLDGSVSYTDKRGNAVTDEDIKAYFQNTKIVDQSISFTKTDDSGAALPGAVFSLVGNGKSLTATSDANGVVTFTGLTAGTYVVTEVSAPAGYIKSGKMAQVVVNKDNTVTFDREAAELNFVNIRVKADIEFTKYDNLGNGLPGARFSIVNAADNTVIETKTFETSTIKFEGLYVGTYKITETSAPDGYKKSDFVLTATVNADGTVTFTDATGKVIDRAAAETGFINTLTVDQSISFVKYDDSKKVLEGAVFTLTSEDGEVMTAVSDATGTVTFTGLTAGTYTLTEIEAPYGYRLSGKTITIKVGLNNKTDFDAELAETTFVNTLVKANIELVKMNNLGKVLAGAEFTITDSEGNAVATATSAATGKVTFTGMTMGTYVITETKAPEGYTGSGFVLYATVNLDGSVTYANADGVALTDDDIKAGFVNTMIVDQSISFVKTDDSGAALAGATFTLTGEDGKVMTATSDKDGVVTFTGLTAGTYTLAETEAPYGYRMSGKTITVTVNKDNTTDFDADLAAVEFANTLVKADVIFTKLDNFGEKLEGATFKLTDAEGNTVKTKTFTTATISFTGLTMGDYTITETSAPAGYEKSEFVLHLTVNLDGSVTFTNAAGKVIDRATAEAGFQNTLIVNQSIKFTKTDDSGAALAGATFTLTDAEGTVVATVTSGIDGKVEFTGLTMGTYTITEIEAPYGYRKSDKTYTFEVKVDNTTTFSPDGATSNFVNTLVKADVEFVKMSNLDKGLAGAEFTLTDAEGKVIAKATSGASGKVTFTGLTMGTYVITETGVPEGYTGSSFELYATVNLDGSVSYADKRGNAVTDEDIIAYFRNTKIVDQSVSFTKTDNSGKALAGATFNLVGNGMSLTAVSDANGVVTFTGLTAGTYVITEVSAPDGYIKSTKMAQVVVNKDNTVTFDRAAAELNFVNTLVTADVEFTKLDNLGNALAGAEFALTGTSGVDNSAVSMTAKSAATSGKVVFSGLTIGTYTITETKAPAGYEKSDFVLNVTVNQDGTVVFTGADGSAMDADAVAASFVNTLIVDQAVSFTKTDDSGAALAGAEFTLTDAEGNEIATAASDEDGKVTFTGLDIGTYTITETKAPYGYRMSGKTYTFEVKVDNTTTFDAEAAAVDFVNTLVKADVEFVKMSNLDKPLAGAEFTLEGVTDTTVVKTVKAAATTGKVTFSGLTMGTYKITETKAPDGYVKSDFVLYATVNLDGSVTYTADDKEIEIADVQAGFVNTMIVDQAISFVKTDDNGSALAGATFTLANEKGEVIATVTTGKDGKVEFSGLTAGKYTITETSAPAGYSISTESITFEVNKDNTTDFNKQAVETAFINKLIKQSVSFKKISNIDNSGLAGARFQIAKADGTVIAAETSAADGTVTFKDLTVGSYVITETKAPAGYQTSEYKLNVTVNNDGSVVLTDAEGNVVDEKAATEGFINTKIIDQSISFIKYDDNGEVLAGAVFTLTAEDGTVVSEQTAAADGRVTFSNLSAAGTYTIAEKSAPYGYEKSDKTVTFTIGLDNTNDFDAAAASATFTNVRVKADIEFVKLDNLGNGLKGATFRITSAEGNTNRVSRTGMSDADGKVSFTGLYVGTYVITELKAPEGYIASDFELYATVNEDGTVSFADKNGAALTEDQVNAEFANVKVIDLSISFVKYDNEGVEVPGAKFELVCGDITLTATSSKTGRVTFSGINTAGEYTLREVSAPEGYIKSDKTLTVTVNLDNTVEFNADDAEETFINERIKAGIEFTKYDNLGGELKGATFKIKNAAGNPNEVNYSTSFEKTAKIVFNDLYVGEYIITEVAAPENYETSEFELHATVNADGTVTYRDAEGEVLTIEEVETGFVNTLIVNQSFHFIKYSNDGTIVPGAKFTLKNNKTGETFTATSDAKGKVIFSELEAGEYVLSETSAPSGYIRSAETVKVTINADNTVDFDRDAAEEAFVNERIVANVSFIKRDGNNLPLAGATFKIVNASTNSNVVNATVTFDDTNITFSDLYVGEYIITETAAPAGYIKSDFECHVFVGDDGRVSYRSANSMVMSQSEIELLFKNPKIQNEEDSGVMGIYDTTTPTNDNNYFTGVKGDTDTIVKTGEAITYTVIAVVVMAGALVAIIFLARKNKKSKKED